MAVRIVSWVVGVLLGALYLYAAVAGVGNVIGVTGYGAALGSGVSASGVVWLVLGVAVPLVLLVLALLVGRGRRAGTRILVLAAGVALVAVWQIDVMHLIPESSYFG